MAVRYYEQGVQSGLKDKRRLAAFLQEVVFTYRAELKKTTLSFIFCGDDYLLTINNDFLKHDTYTDIITFDLSEKQGELEGEIYISCDRVRDNAKKFNVSYETELHRVIFHGVLHLCGFKDKSAAEKKLMRRKEEACLTAYFSNR